VENLSNTSALSLIARPGTIWLVADNVHTGFQESLCNLLMTVGPRHNPDDLNPIRAKP
jgi:hypothetical protein